MQTTNIGKKTMTSRLLPPLTNCKEEMIIMLPAYVILVASLSIHINLSFPPEVSLVLLLSGGIFLSHYLFFYLQPTLSRSFQQQSLLLHVKAAKCVLVNI